MIIIAGTINFGSEKTLLSIHIYVYNWLWLYVYVYIYIQISTINHIFQSIPDGSRCFNLLPVQEQLAITSAKKEAFRAQAGPISSRCFFRPRFWGTGKWRELKITLKWFICIINIDNIYIHRNMGVRDFRTDFPWFSGLLRYLPARWVTSKWFIADFPGCRLSAWVRRYQLERFSTSFVWGYPKPFHFFGWFIILCMAASTTSWFLAGFFWVSENGAGADVGRGVYFNTYFNHGILKQVADFQINLFQTYFKPISDLFQTYFRPISNLFQTYFKPISNLF